MIVLYYHADRAKKGLKGCSLIIQPTISEFRANFSARNFHEIHRGTGTETEKTLFPFTFYEMVLRYILRKKK